MTCQEAREGFSALLDHEAAAEEIVRLREHLLSCDGCRRDFALTACLDAEMMRLPVPGVPASLWERLERDLPPAVSARDLADREILTPEEAAAYLRITPEELEAEGESPPCFRAGGHVRYRKRALDAWIERQESGGDARSPGEEDRNAPGNVVDFFAARSRINRMGRAG